MPDREQAIRELSVALHDLTGQPLDFYVVERMVDAYRALPDPERDRLREQVEEARIAGQLPRTDNPRL